MSKQMMLGKYEFVRMVGQGASGRVYLVRDIRLKKYWAVKEIKKKPEISFMEAQVMKDLNHPDLPRIVDCIETKEYMYLVIDYIEGINLQSILKKKRGFSDDYVLRWGIQLCHVFRYLHEQKPPIIYCDLKPSNLILTENYQLKLIDFGIALQGKNLQNHGTKGFAAPEQYEDGGYADERSDIYSFGKTLGVLRNSNQNPKLEKVIQRCVKQEPEKRYQTIKELEKALNACERNPFLRIRNAPVKYRRLGIIGVLSLGMLLLGISKMQRDEKTYDQYISQGLEMKSSSMEKRKFQTKVVNVFRKAIEQDSKKSSAYLYLFDYYQQMGREKEGLDTLVQYIESDGYLARECDLVLAKVGTMYLQGDSKNQRIMPDYELAQKYFSMIQKKNQKEDIYLKLVQNLNQDFSKIPWKQVDQQLATLEEKAKDFDTIYTILSVYEEYETYLKEFREPFQVKSHLLIKMQDHISSDIQEQLFQENTIRMKKVDIYEGKEGWEPYVEEYVKVLHTEEEKVDLWIRVAKYYETKKKETDATRIYQQIIDEYPKEMKGYIYYGLFLYQEGKVKEARVMYEEAKRLGGSKQYDYQMLEEKLGGLYEPS